MNRWGCLFSEFKNDKGFFSTQYYLIYFTRRVAFAFSQIFLNNIIKVQGAINICFCILALTHLLYYKPFKETPILITNIIGELNICLITILIYALLWEFDESVKRLIEKTVISSVFCSIFLQMAVSMYLVYKSLQLLWMQLEKKRAMDFVRRFELEYNEFIAEKKISS